MKNRIWTKVNELRLRELKKTLILGAKKNEKYAWGSLEVGSQGFVVNSFLITLSPGEKRSLSQNYVQGGMRFVDTPANHRLRNGDNPSCRQLLEYVIALAVADEYLRGRKDELLTFFDSETKIARFPWFTPNWPASLRIPIEFIRLYNFQGPERGPIYAHIQVGHHLVFWSACVYDRRRKNPFKLESMAIRDPKILLAINKLLAKKKVRRHLEQLIQTGHTISDDTDFIDKITGSNPDSLPPRIRFY